MRTISYLCLLIFSLESLQAQNYNIEAYNFHQSIITAQENIGKEIYEFDQRATELNLKILKFQVNKTSKFIDSLKVYNNEYGYYNATKKLFALYSDLCENEYPQLLKIIEDPELEFKDFKAKKILIFDSMKKKTEAVYPEFFAAQAEYCKKYGIKIDP